MGTTFDRLDQAAAGGQRMGWDDYFLMLAEAAATRSTCSKRKVGAVVVRDRHVVATGYNGGPRGYGHCTEGACPRGSSGAPTGYGYDSTSAEERCIAIHAEANALLFSSPDQRERASLYCTLAPCFGCAKLIANSGVTEVVCASDYPEFAEVKDFLLRAGVRVRLLA